MSLELHAALWLRMEKDCPIVLMERSPRYGHGKPDVLGITNARFMLEIEIKRSLSDFRANAAKHHVRNRDAGIANLEQWPKQFWFLVPPDLVDKVEPELPEWAGLLTIKDRRSAGWYTDVFAIKKAPINHKSKKLSLKDGLKMLRVVGNEVFSLRITNAHFRQSSGSIDPHVMDSFYSKKLEWSEEGKQSIWVDNPDYLNFQI